jgi:uncharacterized membrane protein YqjE
VSIATRWGGMLESLRSLGATGLSFVHTRVHLFGVELEQELWRVRSLLVWSLAALLLSLLALAFAGIALILAFWDNHRLLVSMLLAGFFAVLAVLAIFLLKRSIDAKPRPFDSTLAALERDIAALRNRR